MDYTVIIGSAGVFLLLLAFILNLLKALPQDGRAYILMNVFGAALSCYASFLIGYIPFVVLEGAWTLAALAALVAEERKRI
jgi:hypothetical protein